MRRGTGRRPMGIQPADNTVSRLTRFRHCRRTSARAPKCFRKKRVLLKVDVPQIPDRCYRAGLEQRSQTAAVKFQRQCCTCESATTEQPTADFTGFACLRLGFRDDSHCLCVSTSTTGQMRPCIKPIGHVRKCVPTKNPASTCFLCAFAFRLGVSDNPGAQRRALDCAPCSLGLSAPPRLKVYKCRGPCAPIV